MSLPIGPATAAVLLAAAIALVGVGIMWQARERSIERALHDPRARPVRGGDRQKNPLALLSQSQEVLGRLVGSTSGLAAVLLPILWWLTHNPVAAVLAALLMATGFVALRERQAKRALREKLLSQIGVMVMRIEQQLSAKSLVQAVASLRGDLPEPLASIMDPILTEVAETSRVGRPMRKLADAVPSPETTMLATVFEIAEVSGGRVRDNLQRIGGTIRRRLEMAKEVRAQTAEARNELRMVLGIFAVMLVAGRMFMASDILRAMSNTTGAIVALATPFAVLLWVESILSMGQE